MNRRLVQRTFRCFVEKSLIGIAVPASKGRTKDLVIIIERIYKINSIGANRTEQLRVLLLKLKQLLGCQLGKLKR